MWGKLGHWLAEFIYPKDCVGCGRLGVGLCEKCKENFEEVAQICPMCGKENWDGNVHKMCSKKLGLDGLTAVYDHDEKVMQGLIKRVKFDFDKGLLEELVKLLDFKMGKKFDVVVPVPLSIYRRNWRGFNQAEVIAKEVGEQLDLPVAGWLKRVKRGKQQSRIKKRKERFENIRGVFKMSTSEVDIVGKSILLVDDVFTSGATMREACRVLKRAGAKFVWGLVVCRRV